MTVTKRGDERARDREFVRISSCSQLGRAVRWDPTLILTRYSTALAIRPSDFQASLSAVATHTMKPKSYATKKRKTGPKSAAEGFETYHFIGYVPSAGKVWELDGLKKGPLEVGEIGVAGEHWIDVVRPVLRVKMARYGGTDEGAAGDIRFNLLAVVDDAYEASSDDLELLKRRKAALERRMGEGWETKVRACSFAIGV